MTLTQVQFHTQRAEALQHGELEFVGQCVCVDGSGASADLRLLHQRRGETGAEPSLDTRSSGNLHTTRPEHTAAGDPPEKQSLMIVVLQLMYNKAALT